MVDKPPGGVEGPYLALVFVARTAHVVVAWREDLVVVAVCLQGLQLRRVPKIRSACRSSYEAPNQSDPSEPHPM